MKLLIFSITTLLASTAFAEGKWSHESELSIVTISGNAESETTALKQTTKYAREKDSATVKAAYTEADALDTTTGQTETSAKSGSASLRYDRTIDNKLGGFISHGVESDKFAGYTQKDISSLGLKYQISKRDDQEWNAELAYVRTTIDYVGVGLATEEEEVDSFKVATDYSKKVNESVTAGLKLSYEDAFADAEGTSPGVPLYWATGEANLAVVMTSLLSLKVSYESKYQNFADNAPRQKRTDTTFTTALVAKF